MPSYLLHQFSSNSIKFDLFCPFDAIGVLCMGFRFSLTQRRRAKGFFLIEKGALVSGAETNGEACVSGVFSEARKRLANMDSLGLKAGPMGRRGATGTGVSSGSVSPGSCSSRAGGGSGWGSMVFACCSRSHSA
jgi:hypothetical protein